MNEFENSDQIHWDEQEVTTTSPDSVLGEVKYLNPPRFFTLRGVRYEFLNMSITKLGSANDGEKWYLSCRVDRDYGESVWVSESRDGEFVQMLIPIGLRGEVDRLMNQ